MNYIQIGKGKIRLVKKCYDMTCGECQRFAGKNSCPNVDIKINNKEVQSKIIRIKKGTR
jgi:hypothetical protein